MEQKMMRVTILKKDEDSSRTQKTKEAKEARRSMKFRRANGRRTVDRVKVHKLAFS